MAADRLFRLLFSLSLSIARGFCVEEVRAVVGASLGEKCFVSLPHNAADFRAERDGIFPQFNFLCH
jgi:hypothetical protein